MSEPEAVAEDQIWLEEVLTFLGALANHDDERDEWDGRDLFRDFRSAAGVLLNKSAKALATSEPARVSSLEERREAIALKVVQYECDHETIDWPEGKCREILAHVHQAHSGDCTKQPWTCNRCVAEDAYRLADAILALPDQASGEIARLRGALEEISDEVFGRQAGDCPDVYADYDRLVELERKCRAALSTSGVEGEQRRGSSQTGPASRGLTALPDETPAEVGKGRA